MMCPDYFELSLTQIGLLLDILGVIFLFFFGLPPSFSPKGHSFLIDPQIDNKQVLKGRVFKALSFSGLTLILLGFILQFFGNY